MMKKPVQPEPVRKTFEIDGYEINATFSEEERPEVFLRIKQILLSSADLKSDMDAA